MRIQNLRKEVAGGKIKLIATISWEQVSRSSADYYFRVEEEYADRLGDAADAFFCAALIPALANGERRIAVDQPVCASLLDNAEEALFWIQSWNQSSYATRNLPEFNVERRVDIQLGKEGSCLFMSGGLDACFSLVHNLERYPKGHPGRISRALFIGGFDIGGKLASAGSDKVERTYRNALESITRICDYFDVELCAVETNIRHLDDTSGFWGREFCGAALAACAHAMGGCARNFYMSSDGEPLSGGFCPAPYGYHPVLTPCYSSYQVQLHYYASRFDSRSQRLERVGKMAAVIDNLRVCFNPPVEGLNCGRCEKCIRTMLELHAGGLLQECSAFNAKLTPELVGNVIIDNDMVAGMYERLRIIYSNHKDSIYADIIAAKLKNYAKYRAWKLESGWKGAIKKLGRRYFCWPRPGSSAR